MHEVDSIIQGFCFVLKGLFFDKQTAECVDTLALDLMGKTPGRTRMFTESRSDAIIVKIRELGLDAPTVLTIAGDPEVGTFCLIAFHFIGPAPCVIVDLESDANQNNRLFNFLLFLFPQYLKAAMRKGLFKKYIRCRYNDGNVKGTIDIARHIEKNIPFTGNVAYSQREFSYDNSLMELVRHTIEFIKRKPYGNKLLVKVKDEVKLVIDATPGYEPYDRQKVIEQNKKNAVRHAYFREYLALQRLCLLILRHQKHQIGSGSRQIYGILFDGAWLWEEYINSLIEDVFYHPMNKGGKGAQRLFDGNVGLIYPDFISRKSEMRMIADAKYKPIDNIGNRDYLQVLAYMFRFDAKTGYYLYPEAGTSEDLKLWMNRGSTYESNVSPRDDISITKHGLKIPMDAQDYDGFVKIMKFAEHEFVSVFLPN